MKLVIDLPDDAREWQLPDIINAGVPLEDIKTAIKQDIKQLADYDTVDTLVDVLRIINKHMQEVMT